MLLHPDRVLRRATVIVSTLCFAAAQAAAAPTDHLYADYNGTNYDFTGLKETVQTGDDDPNPLFEAPSGVGDQLLFSPSSFDAVSTDGSGVDTTHSTFNATISSKNGAFVDLISITEAGDLILTEFPPDSGSPTTGVFASLSGTIMITDALNPADIGTQITFGGAGADFVTVFNEGEANEQSGSFFQGLTPGGTFDWDAAVLIDVFSMVSGVTEVELQLNNFLQANSEGSGYSATIQKKTATGPTISVIPEPGTLVLVAPGLIALAIRARRRRA